jgi:hypothetical protein
MKAWLRGFFYSFPVQLLFLHFRKYQVLLIFWFVLFSTINGTFMRTFGADSLYLAPEYLGNVNALGAGIVGIAIGMFIMSWNIASFHFIQSPLQVSWPQLPILFYGIV